MQFEKDDLSPQLKSTQTILFVIVTGPGLGEDVPGPVRNNFSGSGDRHSFPQ